MNLLLFTTLLTNMFFMNISKNPPEEGFDALFGTITSFDIVVEEPCRVKITVENYLYQFVKEVVDQDYNPGTYIITWDGTNSIGHQVASGDYYIKVKVGNCTTTRYISIVK